ncbi:CarboxypepD_reg-like domain-containing protein [Maribacter sedimenticola]|uniref:CarboxypepD_reg-like domain-containing protein n=1 Tax=Maribacter sedimenticola TaxID=228956 RepID=A0ABY1SFB1_9FLAO|nr:CarboxypepD_reg-like domain-containing protein [Maribacter sedimenticola]
MKVRPNTAVLNLILFLFVATQWINGQDLEYVYGSVVDAENGEPVVFANIHLKNREVGVISNIDGGFRIPIAYKTLGEVIEISCMGFETKEILIDVFLEGQANIIILTPSSFELSEAVVSAKVKKINARDIVRYAIDNIPQNYSLEQFGLVGYYRDYQIENENYTNMNEAIIKIFDAGFASKDNFDNECQLITYKKNLEFKIDSFTKQPYDYEKHSKIIPSAKMENSGGNEFITLNIHDAIRNNKIKTYSFINDMSVDFVENHRFVLKGKTNFKNETIYEIECFYRNTDYYSEGKIFIGATDFAIHKLDYALFKRKKPGELDTAINAEERYSDGFNKTKRELIYHIITEYSKGEKDKMYLNYISFYNKILVQKPAEFNSKFVLDLDSRRFMVHLNRMPENVEKIKKSDFKIEYKGKLLPIIRIRFFEDIRTFKLTPHFIKKETGPILNYLFTENDRLEVSDLTYSYGNIRDSLGNKLDEKKYEYLHQYREFFTQETFPNLSDSIPKDSLMLKDAPLDSKLQPICTSCKTDNYWMNTPLKKISN